MVMHPRNRYISPPDFVALARRYPPLRPYVFLTHTGPSIDFKSPVAQRRLTEALLHIDFEINLSLPDNRLCPPVPNRLNYVLWIQDIVRETASEVATVRGIDIGTGASAIYPLLACRLEPAWQMISTDVDRVSLIYAQKNVERNNLSNRVRIMEVSPSGSMLRPLEEDTLSTYEFTMCNPPFYSSSEEAAQSAEAKEFIPNAVCTGAESEMITPGGEVTFVSRMFSESLQHRTRCRWYTSMLGKMASLPEIVGLLRDNLIDNYAIAEFVQGQTRRWAIAWSFGTRRLPDVHSRISNPTLQSIMPARTTLYQQLSTIPSLSLLSSTLNRVIMEIDDVSVTWDNRESCLVQATANTWSRSARRKKAASSSQACSYSKCSPVVLQCRIHCREGVSGSEEHKSADVHLEYQWVDGSERSVFESFVNHVNRRVCSVAVT